MRLKRAIVVAMLVVVAVIWWMGSRGMLGSQTNRLTITAGSAVLLDAKTGKWVYRLNADKPLPPASMSKMMTEAIVLEAIDQGKIAWNDRLSASDYAAKVGGASMGLVPGQKATVRELFFAMAVHSANDAAVTLAESIAGSESAFVERMNAKAAEIGLSANSQFANATGLPSADLEPYATAAAAGDTVMTAEDVALLAEYLVNKHPELLEVTKRPVVEVNGGESLATTNEMLPGQRFSTKGNEGLKTGYTKNAGYCFTGVTVIGGRRYITVVMGSATAEGRFEETQKLLNYAKERAES
ncbi:D-alanyl-D-alanine carboxypeptidase family protein [Cohnella soli]|uniref:D-alanyl-D-alanine carboxypeptidase family protein n=1 Tax=Cohnella soli TaxID=425005 RepID=A0ABW0HUM9_9BACL